MTGNWNILTGDVGRDERNVAALMESMAELYGPRSLDEVTRGAVDRAILVTGAQRGILLLDDPLSDSLQPHVARDAAGNDLPLDLRYSHSVVRKVHESGQPHRTVDTDNPAAADLGQSILEMRLLSIMAVPLAVKDERIGLLYVDSTVQAKEFNEADFAVFGALGGMIALAVENGRLLDEREEKERLEREMSVARAIQQRLFPVDIEAPSGFEVAGMGRPCEETSGDYYDVIPLSAGRVALVVGDVSGHGLGPALYMASTRSLVHALLGAGQDPTNVLGTLNDYLCRDMPDESFMSLFLGILGASQARLGFASAGHNPAFLRRADGSMEELGKTGPVLGVVEGFEYGMAQSVDLASGDLLFLYTDGIFEAHDAAGDIWGEERFRASIDRHAAAGGSAQEVLEGVLADLEAFRDGHPLDDDITCLVLRRL